MCILDGKLYADLDPGSATAAGLEECTLLTNSQGKELLAPGKGAAYADDRTGKVVVPLRDGKARRPALAGARGDGNKEKRLAEAAGRRAVLCRAAAAGRPEEHALRGCGQAQRRRARTSALPLASLTALGGQGMAARAAGWGCSTRDMSIG